MSESLQSVPQKEFDHFIKSSPYERSKERDLICVLYVVSDDHQGMVKALE